MKRPSNVHHASRKLQKLEHTIKDILGTHSQDPLDDISSDGPLSQHDVIYFQKQAIYRLYHVQSLKVKILKEILAKTRGEIHDVVAINDTLTQWWFQILGNLKQLVRVQESVSDDKWLLSFNVEHKEKLDTLRNELVCLLSSISSSNTSGATVDTGYNYDISQLQREKSAVITENDELRREIQVLSSNLEELDRYIQRKHAQSVERIREVKEEPAVKVESLEVKAEAKQPAPSVDVETVAELEKLRGINEELQKQLDVKIDEITKLGDQLLEIERRSSVEYKVDDKNHNNNDSSSTSNANEKLTEHTNESRRLEELTITKRKLETQLFELESKFTENKNKIEQKYKAELSSNSQYISKLESDLIRIRSDRDSFNAKLQILKNEKGKDELIDNFQRLADTLQKRITELEELNNTKLQELSNDEHSKLLLKELKQLEDAFKSTREICISKLMKGSEFDSIINKLTIEKTKADEKYFQAMRLKDSLQSQNKVLTANVNKQQELIEMLKNNEAELNKKLSIEKELFSKLLKIEEMYNSQLVKLQSTLASSQSTIKKNMENENLLRSQISKLQAQLQNSEKSLQSATAQLSGEIKKSLHYKSQIESYKAGVVPEADNEIQEGLLSMTKCSLCNKNFKSVALKTCGHCFCKDCVEDRLAARMRKCPSCNSQFSRYDVLNIHL